MRNLSKDILLGVAVADALGAPVEFNSAENLDMDAIASNYKDEPNRLTAFGTWNKPVGTFTDDTSMTLCTAQFLLDGPPTTDDLMELYCKWYYEGFWTADNDVFDIGNTTLKALHHFKETKDSMSSGLNGFRDNGNGALMRILPILSMIKDFDLQTFYTISARVTACTHAHEISIGCSNIYLSLAKEIANGKKDKEELLERVQTYAGLLNQANLVGECFDDNYLSQEKLDVNPGGYVVGTLNIAIHSLLTTNSYKEAVLKAISYGGDTDTNAAVTGGLAAIYYGSDTIPAEWLNELKRKEEIIELAEKVDIKYNRKESY